MSKLEFSVQHLFGRGTATPCVARTMLQTRELAKAFLLDEETYRALMDLSHEVMRHLIGCLDIGERIRAEVKEGRRRIDAGDVKIQAGGQIVELPSLGAPHKDVEMFLYNAKLALRDTGGLFEVLPGQKFDHKFHQARAWAAKEFGLDSPLAKLLNDDADWIERVLGLRNAVEHPRTAGRLHVRDFHLATEDGRKVVAPPVWWIDDGEPASVAEAMEVIEHNLLTFYEELLCLLLEIRPHPLAPVICEIPDQERDPAMPMRYAVVFKNFPGIPRPDSA